MISDKCRRTYEDRNKLVVYERSNYLFDSIGELNDIGLKINLC